MVGGQQPGVTPPQCTEQNQTHGVAILGACLGGVVVLILLLIYHLTRLIRR
jgi:flagellar biogenesis protein FliO